MTVEQTVGRIAFSPGPWEVVAVGGHNQSDHFGVMAVHDEKIALLSSRAEVAEAEANAYLIAAAPDLLAALKKIVACCTDGDGAMSPEPHSRREWLDAMIAACAAIAKAEGR